MRQVADMFNQYKRAERRYHQTAEHGPAEAYSYWADEYHACRAMLAAMLPAAIRQLEAEMAVIEAGLMVEVG